MNISCFDDLLSAANQQGQPQRLLLVFANAELPTDCTDAQRQAFESGAGGALVPAMCVDKAPHQLKSFSALKLESEQFNVSWQVVFASTLTEPPSQLAAQQVVEQALKGMVDAIKLGAITHMIAFDPQGHAIALH
jgi:hypothetical protein